MSTVKRRKIETPAENLIVIPREVLKLIKNATEPDLKVIIYLYANGDYTVSEMVRELGLNQGEIEAALSFWRGAGIIAPVSAGRKKKELSSVNLYQTYDSETISEAVQKDNDFRSLAEMVGDLLGRVLNKNDYNSLYYLYDYVNLPADFICGVAQYSTGQKKTSLQYIMKTALGLYDDGIDTYEKLEELIAKKEKTRKSANRLKKICGMGDRDLSPKENAHVERWFETWDIPFDLVKLAYDKTVDATGKVQFAYMNTILKNWHESGYKTEEDVKAEEKKTGTVSSFDDDEFFEAALKKGRKS